MNRKCDCQSLLIEYASGLAARTSAEEKDSFARTWHIDVVRDCGQDAVTNVLLLDSIYKARGQSPNMRPKLVVIVHGIRDEGPWMEMVRTELEKIPNVIAQPIDYEYFNAFYFMTGIKTGEAKATVRQKILAANGAVEPSELIIIAHSFGTFLATEVLKECSSHLKVHKLILCGSVVSRKIQFAQIPNVPAVINECGGRDIWPVLAQGFRLPSAGPYGAAGVFGLRQQHVRDRYHDFGHSAYLERSFVKTYWVPYVSEGKHLNSPFDDKRRKIPIAISYLATFGWLLILVTVCVLLYVHGFQMKGLAEAKKPLVQWTLDLACGAYWLWTILSVLYYCFWKPSNPKETTT